MLETLRHRRWNWVALGAAWMLVVQLVLGGFMLGASAAPAGSGEYFLGVICSSGGDALPDAPVDRSGHAGLPNCCVLGCPGLAAAALPPGTAVGQAPLPETALAVRPPRAAPAPAEGDRSPARARGPPLLLPA